jgi:uncharacterized protein (TIGR03083 family)
MNPSSTATRLADESPSVESEDGQERCCPERLLLTEQRSLIPLLNSLPHSSFTRPTPCPGWSVRDVIAHCAAALTRIAEDRLHDFSPARNQEDVLERHDWPLDQIIDELDRGYRRAGPVIAAANGRLDVIALGEWVHAGDVRAALGITPAYAVEGTDDALALLAACSRARNTPLLAAHLPDRDVLMGTWLPHQKAPAGLAADTDALVRLYTGRPIGDSSFTLRGAAPAELVIYR